MSQKRSKTATSKQATARPRTAQRPATGRSDSHALIVTVLTVAAGVIALYDLYLLSPTSAR